MQIMVVMVVQILELAEVLDHIQAVHKMLHQVDPEVVV
jgi:hypothetical protein